MVAEPGFSKQLKWTAQVNETHLWPHVVSKCFTYKCTVSH